MKMLTLSEQTQKVAAFEEWVETLPDEQKELIKDWARSLKMNMRDMGDKSASELLAEIFLLERKLRYER
jgi:hypothetical protein